MLARTHNRVLAFLAEHAAYGEIVADITIVREDCGVVSALSRADLTVPEPTQHFMNAASAIFSEVYVPSYEDLLRLRIRTTGLSCLKVGRQIHVEAQGFSCRLLQATCMRVLPSSGCLDTGTSLIARRAITMLSFLLGSHTESTD